MTCCKRSGNFWTMVTGCPLVRLTPYIGAVVLYVDLHRVNTSDSQLAEKSHNITNISLAVGRENI